MAQLLEYERREVLFGGQWRFRSWEGIAVLPLGLAACGVMAFAVQKVAWGRGILLGRVLEVGLIIVACCGAVFQVVGICRDWRNKFEICTDGIRHKGRFVPWREIKRLTAIGSAKGQRAKLCYVLETSEGVRHLPMTEPLSPRGYEAVMEKVRAALGDVYPRLEIGGYRREGGEG